jgi:hypothetical protein
LKRNWRLLSRMWVMRPSWQSRRSASLETPRYAAALSRSNSPSMSSILEDIDPIERESRFKGGFFGTLQNESRLEPPKAYCFKSPKIPYKCFYRPFRSATIRSSRGAEGRLIGFCPDTGSGGHIYLCIDCGLSLLQGSNVRWELQCRFWLKGKSHEEIWNKLPGLGGLSLITSMIFLRSFMFIEPSKRRHTTKLPH